jgi:hypothetical protein
LPLFAIRCNTSKPEPSLNILRVFTGQQAEEPTRFVFLPFPRRLNTKLQDAVGIRHDLSFLLLPPQGSDQDSVVIAPILAWIPAMVNTFLIK